MQDRGGARVLIVDDSEFMRDLLSAAIAPIGVQVVQAENGFQALECLSAQAVDLIITDLNMPNMTGIEFIERVRASSKCPSCPAFVTTAAPSPATLASGRQAGVSAWIIKPVNLVHVRLAVSRVLGIDEPSSAVPPTSTPSPGRPSLGADSRATDSLPTRILVGTLRNTLQLLRDCHDTGKPPPASLLQELERTCQELEQS